MSVPSSVSLIFGLALAFVSCMVYERIGKIKRSSAIGRMCICGAECVLKRWTRLDHATGHEETTEGYACDSSDCRYNPTRAA